jgi:hypothetical protein
MNMKLNHYFKKKLDVPQDPPVDSWEFIQQQIEQNTTKRKPVVPFWFKTSGIAAIMLLLLGTGYLMDWNLFSNSTSQDLNSSSDQSLVKNQEDVTNSTSTSENELSPNSIGIDNEGLNGIDSNSTSNSSLFNSSSNYSFANSSVSQNNPTNNRFYDVNSTFQSINQSNSFENNSNLSREESLAKLQEEFTQAYPFWKPEFTDSEKVVEKILSEEPNKDDNPTTLLAVNSKPDEKKKVYTKKKEQFDRFFISGFISPMALNTFVGNSMLSDEMSQYKTENNVLLAYGVKGGYAISPKVKIRTGVSVIGFEQITKDVPFSYEIEGVGLFSREGNNNIKYHGNIRIDNAVSVANNEITNRIGMGDVQQQSQYIEIPLEAEVSLFKTSSIGISATGGGSTWLLSKNKIFAHTDEFTQELGKAENLNKTSFSANAGLKFDMNLTDNIQLNVEPTFKYLINPVNDIENYNPYSVGVNAGFTVTLK